MHTFTNQSRTKMRYPWAPLRMKMYQKKISVRAIRISGPFEIVNEEGETTDYCIDGYLIYYDNSNTPGAMSARVFERLYGEVL